MDRIYAIGDIHGRLDLLDRAIEAIRRDVEDSGPAALTVTLGDYIDRGPDSFGVIDRLAANPFPTPYVALKGNHEAMLERFLIQPGIAEDWRHFGCIEMLHSYGVPVADMIRGRHYEAAAQALSKALPATHRDFLDNLPTSHAAGRYFFCHAGIRPGVALARQRDDDLMWIRDEFLSSAEDFGGVVVHGHTPVPEPDVKANRINIDTGAFATGLLTCIALERDGHRFLKL